MVPDENILFLKSNRKHHSTFGHTENLQPSDLKPAGWGCRNDMMQSVGKGEDFEIPFFTAKDHVSESIHKHIQQTSERMRQTETGQQDAAH